MTKVGLISDTHGFLGSDVMEHLASYDEIWHAGDIGPLETLEKLESLQKPIRGVYGNIDDVKIRACWPMDQHFSIDGLRVYMTHIGGYPGRYRPRVRSFLQENKVDLFISGHSHILKIIPDTKHKHLHINPGACGHHGFHIFRTMVSFHINKGKIEDLKVIELGKRGKLS